MQAEGARSQILIAEESVYGTVVTPATSAKGVRFVSETFQDAVNVFESQEIRSDRMVQAIKQGNERPGGDIVVELNPEGLEPLWRHLLGTTTSTSGSGPYTHTIKGSQELPVSLSLEKGFTDIDQYFTYAGARINQCACNFPQEGLIQATFSMAAKTEEVNSSSQLYETPVYTSTEPYVSFEAALKLDTVLQATITAINFTIANSLREDQFVIGSRTRYNLPAGKRRITGQFTAFFEDATLYNKFKNNTTAAIEIKVLDSGGTTYYTKFSFWKVKYAGASPTPTIPDDGPVVQTFAFQAFRDSVNGTDVTLELYNSIATLVA